MTPLHAKALRSVTIPAVTVTLGIFIVISAMEFYVVRELLAAFVIFSFLFGVVAMALLVLVLSEKATFKVVTLLERRLARIQPRNVLASVFRHSHPVRRSQCLMSIGKGASGLPGHAASRLTNKLLLLFILLGISAFDLAVLKASVSAVSGTTRTNRIASHYQEQVAGKSSLQPATSMKVAEGEYVIFEKANGGLVGPAGEEISHFHESWTLWRAEKDQYRVEGVREFETPTGQDRSDRFVVELSRDLTVLRMTDFAKLKWVRDSGPLSCDFLPMELHCSSGGSNPKRALQLRTHLDEPYGLLWPISPFSLTGITREVERDPSRTTPVDLLTIEQPSASNPIQTTILSGPLRYLGEEEIEAAGRKWLAHKFSIKVAMHPEFLVWTSAKGLLLAITVKHENKDYPEEWMRLQSFRSWTDF